MRKNYAAPLILGISALLLSFWVLFLRQIPEFSVRGHAFHPAAAEAAVLTALFAFLLTTLWSVSGRLTASAWKLDRHDALKRELWTLTPLLFLSFLPLMMHHYLGANDLLVRTRIWSLAVFTAVLYLKSTNILLLEKRRPGTLRLFTSKLPRFPLRTRLIILFAVAVIITNTGSLILSQGTGSFSGDEPHYLLIAHSLLEDGDFDLSNNYAENDYSRYMPKGVHIDPHTAPGTNGRYSFHSPGISLLLLPFYALGSLGGTTFLMLMLRFGMSLFGSLLGIQIYLWALSEWDKPRIALRVWLVFSLTLPVFFYSIHIYPEIVIALFSMTVFRLLRSKKMHSSWNPILCGFLLSLFIWFHALKYLFILGPLLLYGIRIILSERRAGRNLLYFLAGPVVIIGIYFIFQFRLYGSFSLSAVSWRGAVGGQNIISYLKELIFGIPFHFRWETLAGYFLDQRDGLLLYAPVYAFSFLGMIEMARRRRHDFIWMLFLIMPYVLISAFLTQRTGYAPQARPLVAISWGLGIFLGYFLAHNVKQVFAGLFSLSWLWSLSCVVLLLGKPRSLYQLTTMGETDRAGSLFVTLSNLHFALPRYLPSFLKLEDSRWTPNAFWIVGFLIFVLAYVLIKRHTFQIDLAFRTVAASAGLILFFIVFAYYPRITIDSPQKVRFPSGDEIILYGYSREARMEAPGRFRLNREGRSYSFFFTSPHEFKRIRIEFGASEADYSVDLLGYDFPLFQGKTNGSIQRLEWTPQAAYRWKKKALYRIRIRLDRLSGPLPETQPFRLTVTPLD